MLDTKEIHARAERHRKKAMARGRRKHKKSLKTFRPQPSDSRYVFHQIYPHHSNKFLTLLLPLMIFVSGLVLWYIDKKNFSFLMPWLWITPAIPVSMWILYSVREQIDFSHYKTWRKDLGFMVHGWDKLGQREHFPHWKYWDSNTILSVQVKPQMDTAGKKLLADMLYLSAVANNGCFYEADFVQPGRSGDSRHKWSPSGDLEISGSTNSGVAGEIYLFIDKQLRAFHAERNLIESVTIHFSGDLYEVEPVQVSD